MCNYCSLLVAWDSLIPIVTSFYLPFCNLPVWWPSFGLLSWAPPHPASWFISFDSVSFFASESPWCSLWTGYLNFWLFLSWELIFALVALLILASLSDAPLTLLLFLCCFSGWGGCCFRWDNQYLDIVNKSGGNFISIVCESFGVWIPAMSTPFTIADRSMICPLGC